MSGGAAATVAAHADWSVDPRKRWMTVAVRSGQGWQVAAPAPVGALDTLFVRLHGLAAGGAVALGVDFPVGLPRAYAARRPEADFPAFLRELAMPGDFFRVCATLDEVAEDRPFYPARGLRGMTRAAHAAALGLDGAAGLSRWCDRATTERPAGAPLFWTLGANQTGKAAIIAWRDLLAPALAGDEAVRLWPFAGDFLSTLAPGVVTVAETYPAEAMRQVGLRMNGSKRRQADRAALADGLLSALAARRAVPSKPSQAAIVDGFGADAAGEDRFDSVFGLLSVLGVLQGMRPDGIPDDPWLRRWEGWVLGQTALPVW